MSIKIEVIRMPQDADEMQRLVQYLNMKWGAHGWSVGGVTTAAASSALMFVFQKPVLGPGLGEEDMPGVNELQPAGEGEPPGPAATEGTRAARSSRRSRRRRDE